MLFHVRRNKTDKEKSSTNNLHNDVVRTIISIIVMMYCLIFRVDIIV